MANRFDFCQLKRYVSGCSPVAIIARCTVYLRGICGQVARTGSLFVYLYLSKQREHCHQSRGPDQILTGGTQQPAGNCYY